ncbi:cyclic nucleotide-binding domain-containing protein [Leptothoe sp. ISB3NOV94-8A]
MKNIKVIRDIAQPMAVLLFAMLVTDGRPSKFGIYITLLVVFTLLVRKYSHQYKQKELVYKFRSLGSGNSSQRTIYKSLQNLSNTLNEGDLAWLSKVGEKRQLKSGEILIDEQKHLSHLFIVISGNFRVYSKYLEASEVANIEVRSVVGEMSFLTNMVPSATVEASSESLILAISRSDIEKRIVQESDFGYRFSKAIASITADRLKNTTIGYWKNTHRPSVSSPYSHDNNLASTQASESESESFSKDSRPSRSSSAKARNLRPRFIVAAALSGLVTPKDA